MISPQTVEELQDAARSLDSIRVAGGGTKPALSRDASLSTEKLNGILEYDPSEYTFTALAGTPLSVIRDALAENGQFLTFDPPLVEAGGTIGGTVAAGISGPGRFRFGGVRDFILGVKMVTGEGRVVFGGGKVVKNAAGFDIPKLNTGACGQFGVLAELTFKVFPAPEEFATILIETDGVDAAHQLTTRLAMCQVELFCLDTVSHRVEVRIGGLASAIDVRCQRIQDLAEGYSTTLLRGDDDFQHWNSVREFHWLPAGHSLVKLPVSPTEAAVVSDVLVCQESGAPHRFSVGANVAWIAWPDSLGEAGFDECMEAVRHNRLALTGTWKQPAKPSADGEVFAERIRSVFDPTRKFA